MTSGIPKEFLYALHSMEPCTSLELTVYLSGSLSHSSVLYILNIGLIIDMMTVTNHNGKMLWSLTDLTRDAIRRGEI